MALDYTTLLVAYAMIRVLQAVALVYVWGVHRRYAPLRELAVGSVLVALGTLVISASTVLSPALWAILQNVLIGAGVGIFNVGLVRMSDRPAPWRLAIGWSALFILARLAFVFIWPNNVVGLAIFTVFIIGCDGYTAACLLRVPRSPLKITQTIIAGLLIVEIAATIQRVGLIGWGQKELDGQAGALITSNMAQSGFMLSLTAVAFLLAVFIAILTNQRLQRALDLAASERNRIQESLQFANALLAAQLEGSPDGILVANQNRRIVLFNQRFGEMWRIPQGVVAAGSDEVVLKAGTAQLKEPQKFYDRVIWLYDHPEEIGNEEIEFKDGRIFHRHSASLYAAERRYLGRVWFFRDITAQKQAEADLRHTSSHDSLTGLANRRVFIEGVQQAIARAQRGDKGFAVLFLDLDHFKDVNDTLGHPAGDDLLRAVADRLRSNAREADLVARFGGDEFAVIAAVIDEPADAANLADKLVAAIGSPFSIQGNNIQSGVSIGIAVYEPGDADPETLLAHADVALYRAKADGRSGYRFFTDAMDAEVRTRVIMSGEIREAIASGQLFLRYQPQIEAQTRRIVGVEALVRWNHPLRGVLLPGEFIPVAEKAGLGVALDRWVGREACRQARDWLDEDIEPVVMSVNISGAQFKRPIELENDVALVLEKSGLPPHLLELELTETVLMEASHEHNEVLARLRRSGVRLSIDDFGTGYSSLDYLRRYPADRVKIAQDFVGEIAFDPGSAAIVRATIALTRELGMVAIAEGVETLEQFELLKAWGCTQMQGFYFAEPLAPEEILPLLLRGRILEPTVTFGKTAA